MVQPDLTERMEAAGEDFDEWYAAAHLWAKMSPDLPQVSFSEALSRLRERTGTVLFMSESESTHKPCALIHHGRPLTDFVAMADPRDLADRIEYEWMEAVRLFWEEERLMADATLPEDLYVFDTGLDWVIVFTHESVSDPEATRESAESRRCLTFGT